MKNRIFDVVMPILPKHDLSHWVGRAVHHPIPGPVGRKSVEWFAKFYNIDMNEAEHPISHYKTIGQLFTRKLKEGVRPIADKEIVHCADAVITEAGRIEAGTLIQAKGKTYTVSELLKSSEYDEVFEGGAYATYYLCPTDYHRVHSPVSGQIIWSSHIPGEMWPVNAWSVNAITNLFGVNERVAVIIQTPKGKAALVMVAATNVGNMTMSFDNEITTASRRGERQIRSRKYDPPHEIAKGDEVGIFHMGSTVVMLYEKSLVGDRGLVELKGKHAKMGGAF